MADQEPPAVHQETTASSSTSAASKSSEKAAYPCPFCTIALNFPPTPPLSDTLNSSPAWNPDKLMPPSYVLLSTEDVVAFLDIAPLTRGHVLVAPRKHRVKVGDMTPGEMAEVGRVLPLVARAVIRAVLPDIPHAEADYNIVQNNGPGAAQVVPHVHFHIVPRPPLDYRPPSPTTLRNLQISPPHSTPSTRTRTYSFSRVNHTPPRSQPTTSIPSTGSTIKTQGETARRSKYPPNEIPTGMKRSYIQFGRGMRHELDDDDALELVEEMRRCVADEWRKEVGNELSSSGNEDGNGENERNNKVRERGRGARSPEKL